MEDIRKAIALAKRELRDCYYAHGIVAGNHHFTDYWARDGFFAGLGSIGIGDYDIVRRMVDFFLSFQREDGLIPYRLMNGPVTIGKYLGHPKKYISPRPTYRLRGIFSEVYDGTTLAVLLLTELILGGKADLKKYEIKIEKALRYLGKKERFGLLWDGVMCEWNDTAYKYGNLLYSNIIYWQMFNRLNTLPGENGKKWHAKQEAIGKAIRDRLWTGEYFADWNDYKRQDYYYAFGNLLAVAWGLAAEYEAKNIMVSAEKAKIGFTLETNSPCYPFWRIDILHRLAGMGDYQNKGILWWQPACAYAYTLAKTGKKKEATIQLALMARQALRYNGFYECYERSGIPVSRKLYKSEHPFAWAAGLFLWAASLIMPADIMA